MACTADNGPEGVPEGTGKRRFKRLLPLGVGLILLAAVLASVNLRALGATLMRAQWRWYGLALGGTAAFFLLASWRWGQLLRLQGLRFSYREVFLMYNAGSLVGAVTPGRLGDLARLGYFRGRPHSLVPATLTILVDRGLDVVALGLLALASLGFVPLPGPLQSGVWLAGAGVLLAGAVLLLLPARRGGVTAWLLQRLPMRLQDQAGQGLEDLRQAWERCSWWGLGRAGILTAAAWGINILGIYGVVRALQLPLSLGQAAACFCLSTVFTLLPVSVAGLGTREVSCVFLFALLGLGREEALGFSFLLLGLVVAHGLVGWLCVTLRPPFFGGHWGSAQTTDS